LQALLEVVADKTGYLVQTLNSGMDLEADLGIDSIRRVQVLATLRDRVDGMPDPKSVRMRQLLRLRTLGEIAEQLGETATPPVPARQPSMPAATVSTPPRRMITRAVAVPAPGLAMPGLGSGHLAVTDDGSGVAQHVVEHLAAHGICARICAEPPSDAIGLIVLGHSAEAQSPDGGAAAQRAAFRAARTIAPALMTDQGVFVTVQDTGGDFGLNGRSGEFVWAGGLAGLARTAAKEWPRASVKAIDCHRAGRTTIDIAHAIVEELVTGGPALNVGLPADGARLTLETVPAPIVTSTGGRLGPESVVVATGGARGVTAAALRELAMAYQPRILLIGRTPLVDEPAELSDARDEVALISRLSTQSRQPAAPAELAARARALLAAREVRGTLAELAKAGATVRYAPMDVTQVDALSAVLDEVRREWGPIDGIVHGAGVLADKQIADKTDEQFDRVFDTKVRGLAALLTATADDPLRLLCVFSSVAARYGNPGQCDYAMANETLTQVLMAERARRPDCLVRAIAWGPWEGGMVTPALAEHFRSEDVAMIPLAQGARAFVDELAGPAADVQVIITAEPELGTAAEYGVCAEAHLDEKSHPQLSDHEIDGVPVLPLAVGLDIMARLARSCRPADEGIVVRDVQAVRRIKLPDLSGGGHRLLVKANPGADTVLEMRFLDDAAPRLRARFIGGEPLRAATWMLPPDLEPFDQSDIYDGHVLFHGPGFQVLQAVHGISDAGALATVAGLADRGWTGEHWQTDPAAVDGCLQLALLWANRVVGATLPVGVTQLRLHRTGPLPGSALCVVRAREIEDGQANCDVVLFDEAGPTRIELLGVTLVQRPA
jgi:NAD(P)-dependent dehydrogenase (short-subunit alcohol dehydrogenase family)